MVTVVLGLCGALSYALSDFLAQRVTRGGASVIATVTWILTTGSAITVPAAFIAGGVPHGPGEWSDIALAAVGGAVYLIGYGSLVRGLRVGNISLVTPLASLEGAVAALIAIVLLGEAVNGLTTAGLALAVVGSVLASVSRGPRGDDPDGPRAGVRQSDESAGSDAGDHNARRRLSAAAGAGWGILSAAAAGVVFVIYGEVTAVSPLVAVAASRVAGLVLIVPFAVRFGARVPRGQRRIAVLSGTLEAMGFLLIVAALTVGPISTASVLAAQFATFAVLLGLIVGRERPARVQLVGVVLTIVAVTVLALA